MKLTEIEAQFVRLDPEDPRIVHYVDTIEEADGIDMLCPLCFKNNNGPIGTHMVRCWRPRISQDHRPRPGRWELVGTGYHDLTLVAGSSSIHLTGPGCGAHFFIKNGEVEFI